MEQERQRRGWLAVIVVAVGLVALAVAPWLVPKGVTPPWVSAAQNASPVPLPKLPPALKTVQLGAAAQPVDANATPASQPTFDSTHEAALVAGEDNRLRVLLHKAVHMRSPATLAVPGSSLTLVLPGRSDPYTFSDLVSTGAAVPLAQQGWYLLVDSVLVARSATLQISSEDGGPATLLLASSATSFTSLVTWGGSMTLAGTAQSPLAITGWDQVNNQPSEDRGYGRPYIRAVGGEMQLSQVRASHLGFWSGRTGGVSWTGVTRQAATGGATDSSFIGDTYGSFVTRASQVHFSGDLFESNELDGLRLHRDANNSTVTSSASVRNGSNGFVVSRGANSDLLSADVALHNGGNGFLFNGQPLVNGAGPSGGQTQASVGTQLSGSDSERNVHTGILVEGGSGTVIQNNIVCAGSTAIAIRLGAATTSVVGNQMRCARVALSIGPAVTATTVAGNVFSHARIGILIRNSPGVRLLNNQTRNLTVFAISVRGASPGVVGSDNVFAGNGFQPVDFRGGAAAPQLTGTDLRNWFRVSSPTALSYLRYHPLLTTWLGILLLVALSWIVVRLRRRSRLPYRHALVWAPAGVPYAAADGLAAAGSAGNGHTALPTGGVAPIRVPTPTGAAIPAALFTTPSPAVRTIGSAPAAALGQSQDTPRPAGGNGNGNGNGHLHKPVAAPSARPLAAERVPVHVTPAPPPVAPPHAAPPPHAVPPPQTVAPPTPPPVTSGERTLVGVRQAQPAAGAQRFQKRERTPPPRPPRWLG